MFRRKPKTRMERTRHQLQVLGKEARSASNDVVKQLNATAKHLRSDVQDLLEVGDERVSRIAKELEHVAQDIEKRTGKRVDAVSEKASENVWYTVMIALVIGLAIGWLLKDSNK
jgi:ElaB/YqjD/DUF883 family membrane-anchored ribosome-binding protein